MKKSKLNVNEILTKYQNIPKTIPQQLQLNKILTKSRAAKLILVANFVTEFQMRHATRYEHILGRPKHTHTQTNTKTYQYQCTLTDTNAQNYDLCSGSRIAYRKSNILFNSKSL